MELIPASTNLALLGWIFLIVFQNVLRSKFTDFSKLVLLIIGRLQLWNHVRWVASWVLFLINKDVHIAVVSDLWLLRSILSPLPTSRSCSSTQIFSLVLRLRTDLTNHLDRSIRCDSWSTRISGSSINRSLPIDIDLDIRHSLLLLLSLRLLLLSLLRHWYVVFGLYLLLLVVLWCAGYSLVCRWSCFYLLLLLLLLVIIMFLETTTSCLLVIVWVWLKLDVLTSSFLVENELVCVLLLLSSCDIVCSWLVVVVVAVWVLFEELVLIVLFGVLWVWFFVGWSSWIWSEVFFSLGRRRCFVIQNGSTHFFDHRGTHMLEVLLIHKVNGGLQSLDHVYELEMSFRFIAEVSRDPFIFIIM